MWSFLKSQLCKKKIKKKKVLKKPEESLSKKKFEDVRPVRTVAELMLNKP